MRIQKSSRPGVILMATVVAIITSVVVANATQTITTPNAAFVSYNLAAGADSAAITPAASRSVLVMACSVTDGGLCHFTLFRRPSVFLEWVGFSSPGSGTIGGGSLTPGTHIAYIDLLFQVDIRMASADTILIHNGRSSTVTGNVTLIW